MRFVGVIPARYASKRLPGKPLLEIGGKTLVQWVYLRALQSTRLNQILVATDDERIFRSVRSWDGNAVMTSDKHRSGTERVAEVAQGIEADVYINLQCDEPTLPPTTIDRVCACFDGDLGVHVATACVPIPDPEAALDPHVVKVVTDSEGRALYFSRAPIPFAREGQAPFFKHLGIYGYRRRLLLNLARLRPSPLEEIEKLEQLRFLENRIPIQVATVDEDSIGVDTQEDLERVRPFFENGSLTVRGESPASTETVPAPTGPGAMREHTGSM